MPLVFRVVPEQIRFESLTGTDLDLAKDELFVGFRKDTKEKGDLKSMSRSKPRPIESALEIDGQKILIAKFEDSDILEISSTLFQDVGGEFEKKKAELSVWLKQHHNEIMIGKIIIELHKCSSGATQRLEAVFHHEAKGKKDKIVVKNAYVRIKLSASNVTPPNSEEKEVKEIKERNPADSQVPQVKNKKMEPPQMQVDLGIPGSGCSGPSGEFKEGSNKNDKNVSAIAPSCAPSSFKPTKARSVISEIIETEREENGDENDEGKGHMCSIYCLS
tara:strand:+ start:169 stop:993 length:825 start_codon:yes stop_codon:yes gene_type:complete